MRKVKLALYGDNGHQIYDLVANHPLIEAVGVCAVPVNRIRALRQCFPDLVCYSDFESLLQNSGAELISLCSPLRRSQAADAIRAMRAGKHVYAEKPAAFNEEELNAVLRVSGSTGCLFHEMADTVFHAPFYSLRKMVLSGAIGEVAQVFVQKSYPYLVQGMLRPQNKEIDGGLTLQAGIHALRMAEHCTGLQVREIRVAVALQEQ